MENKMLKKNNHKVSNMQRQQKSFAPSLPFTPPRSLSLLLLLFFLSFLSSNIQAQCTVKGVLFDESNGEAIPFANVVLDGTTHGCATDINGFFLINKVPEGSYTLKVKYVGYEEFTEQITLQRGKTLSRTIHLKPAAQMLKAVEITDNKKEERQMQTQVSVEKITASQIQQMPSIGGTADIAQYMQVLPGVNSTGDQGGQLYIRGGSMIQNLTLLDGMIVYNPFHSIGLYSIFETDVILNADIYTGGFGAEYGGTSPRATATRSATAARSASTPSAPASSWKAPSRRRARSRSPPSPIW